MLYVERDSQKGIVLGAKGRTIREIGTASRVLVERLVEGPVYLDLWVKVMPDWRKDAVALSSRSGSARLAAATEGEPSWLCKSVPAPR